MHRPAKSWQIIESVLQEHARSIYRCLRRPATATAVRKFEMAIGCKLPKPLVASLLIHDGTRQDLVDGYSLLSAVEIRQWREICLDNPWDEPGPKFNDRKQIKGELRWRPNWVPIASDAGGNLLGCDLDPGPMGQRGQVFSWHNYGSPKPYVLAASYADWLDAIAEELLSRQFTLDEWGGIQLNRSLV